MSPDQLHQAYLHSYDLFVRAYGKSPTHLLLTYRDFKSLSRAADTRENHTEAPSYHGLFIVFTAFGTPRVALL